ncbi:MAG TPA: winged helix-turn-helix domain-containing protein [Vicinamibacterales bacterium]|nr:winged helix-turn-helix domain-containing protein [Vicinamibacterales bacterium]
MAKVARFGVFELDLRSGELRKHGIRVRLQGKAFRLLQALLERPGDVVTREELQRRLWPAGVYVEAESGLNTAANRLRLTLGDSPEHPRYIETLARTGYRFIAPVEIAESATPSVAAAAQAPGRRRTALLIAGGLAIGAIVVSATAMAFRRPRVAGFEFRQVTYRHGQVSGARFAPDGHAILYSAAWDNGPRQLFLTNPYSPESRNLGITDLRLVSVSRSGELALLSSDGNSPINGGALGRVAMNGGSPLTIDRNIMSADWAADGGLAVVRAIDGVNQLEFPVGHVLYKTAGWISSVRIAPHDDRLAFIEHPVRHDNRGTVRLIDPGRPVRSLTPEWANAGGIAWHPASNEVWFTASRDGEPKSLWAATPAGDVRSITQIAGTMTLRDITADGRALITRETEQLEMATVTNDDSRPQNLSWLDWSRVADVSADGRVILFDESGVAAGARYMIYLYHRDTQSTVRLAEGRAMALSPDVRFALTLGVERRAQLHLVPLADGAAGSVVDLPATGLEYQWARYFPDGKRLLALANEANRPLRLYVQPLDGQPFPITPPIVVRNVAISPSGDRVAVLPGKGTLEVYPTAEGSGAVHEIPTSAPLAPLLWAPGDWLYVQHIGAYTQIPTRVSRLNLADGRLEPQHELRPADTLGVNAITKVMLSQDTRTVVFNYRRVLSELFVAEPASR